jgi:hypothetical protein
MSLLYGQSAPPLLLAAAAADLGHPLPLPLLVSPWAGYRLLLLLLLLPELHRQLLVLLL